MTIKFENGKATIPLWAAIVLIVTIILATTGWVALATEKANAAAHEAISNRVTKLEQVIASIPEMQKDIAVIAALLNDRSTKK